MAKTNTEMMFSTGWEERLLRELAEEWIQEANADQPTEIIPAHELMTTEEVLTKLRMSLATLYRNTKSRKLACIKRDGRLMFKHTDVERYDAKRYLREK